MDSKPNLFVNEKPSLNKRGGFLLIADLLTPLPLTIINNAIKNNKNNLDMPLFKRKRKGRVKKAIKKITKKVTAKADKAKKKIALAKVAPFAPVMRRMLKKRGFDAPRGVKNLDKLTASFYLNIVKKAPNNYEFSEGISEEYQVVRPENIFHPLNNQGGNSIEFDFNQFEVNYVEASPEEVAEVASKADAIITIVDKILGLINRVTSKIRGGQQLDETEREISKTVEESKDEIKETEEQGAGMFGGSNMLIIVGIIVVAFFFLKK